MFDLGCDGKMIMKRSPNPMRTMRGETNLARRLTGFLRRMRPGVGRTRDASDLVLNDVQSQLNPTRVARIVRADSIEQIRLAIREARHEQRAVSMAGGRHAQGGQQFGTDTIHLTRAASTRYSPSMPSGAFVDIEGGIQWPDLIDYLHQSQKGSSRVWTIRQKQTGVDRVSYRLDPLRKRPRPRSSLPVDRR